MKKLLVTVIGAAAITASAAPLVMQDFEDARFTLGEVVTTNKLNTVQGENVLYWTDNDTNEVRTATNEYKIVETGPLGERSVPAGFSATQYNALQVKTTFGKPLSLNVNDGGTGESFASGSRLFFDSLVKFTVCEEDPTEEYENAKIVMWLQEETNSLNDVTGTNLMVKAGYLSYDQGLVVTPKVYNCGPVSETFTATEWHRVTIKAVDDITAAGDGVPGFLIYIDGNNSGATEIASMDSKKDSSFTSSLAEAVSKYGSTIAWHYVFPSMVQSGGKKLTIESASFDGTGTLETLSFTKDVPAFAADYVAPEAPKAEVYLNGSETPEGGYSDFADVLAIVNALEDEETAKIVLLKDMELSTPIVFSGENGEVTLDFAGHVITNTIADAIITNNAAALIITNSTGKGGIYCEVVDAYALCQNTDLTIAGGNFWGLIDVTLEATSTMVTGGAFLSTTDVDTYLASDKEFAAEPDEDGLYPVVDKAPVTTWTVGFYDDEGGSLIGTTQDVTDGELAVAPAAPTKAGYDFVDWTPSTNVAITANTNFYPIWAKKQFTITVAALNQHTTVSVTSNKVEVGTAAGDYVFEYDDEAIVTFAADTGYDLANDTSTNIASVTENVAIAAATVTAHAYSISYELGLGTATNATAAVTSFTIEDASVTLLPAGCDGYTFNGWTNANGTAVSSFVPAELSPLANQTFYASWSAVTPTPTPIDPSADKVETVVTADSESDAKANAVITPPAGSGADAAEYKALFDFDAVSNGDGTWTVTLTGIKDTVEEGVDVEAVKALTTTATTMQIPAGLYYRITPSTALPISGTSFGGTTPSTGSVSVEGHKPASTDKGFYKVELDYKPITD